MIKRSERGAAPRPAVARRPVPRKPFTFRVTPAAQRKDAGESVLEFSAEVEPAPTRERSAAVIPFVPAAAAPRAVAAVPRAPVRPRVIWLVAAAVGAAAAAVWIAGRDAPVPESPSPTRTASPPALEPREGAVVLATAGARAPVAPVLAASVPTKPAASPRRPERNRVQPRQPIAAAPPAADPASPEPTVFQGRLIVDSEPAGARVFLNGRAVGVTPLTLDAVPAGSRVVRVEADGYGAWSSAVRVVANEQSRVLATLRRP
jgi:hypothetical protein